ncbi:MAG: GNAT family N-acetyltransferase [Flavobacteriales bacterium]|nr:GNAT family N-acetyltransferase [Flavobacteriales bacterium]
MPSLRTLITLPGAPDFHRFVEVVSNCYEPGGPRSKGGHEPDEKHLSACVVVLRDEVPVGRCAFYFDTGAVLADPRTAMVGSYECINDPEIARAIFDEVRSLARKYRIARLIGPMEGNTWNSYRFSDTNDRPRFYMEPYHHAYYPLQWKAEGFTPLARYVSRIDRELVVDQLAIRFKDEDLAVSGITIKPLNKAHLVQELALIGQFSIEAFKEQFLYSPISVEEFVMKYHRLGQLIVPRLALLAVDKQEKLLGFILGIPDMFSEDRTGLIVKSAARRKDAPSGLGTHLLRKLEQSAVELGFTSLIHAFMHEDNTSARRSVTFGADPYGSYTLFEQRLDSR